MDPTLSNLAGLRPDVRDAAIALINAYRAAGIPAIITSGKRSVLLNSSVGGALRSLHLQGRAFDVGFLDTASVTDTALYRLSLGGRLWASWGGRWGGNFGSPDPIHFDDG